MPRRNIANWASPTAKRLYLETNKAEDGAEDGEKVRLILNLAVAHDKLHEIYNHYVDASVSDELVQAQFTDSLLFKLLQESHGKLRDIVATIQAQQYRIIQSPLDQVLVVQGAPGSGKTSIALHRVAYLLYNYQSEHFTARNILILGPNRLFLGHISAILPSLGERRVPQKTVDEWTVELLGDKLVFEAQEESLEALLDPTQIASVRAMHYRNARNKGSLQMGVLIDRYIQSLYTTTLERITATLGCTFDLRGRRGMLATVERSADHIRALLETVQALPLNQQREAVEKLLVRDVSAEARAQLSTQLNSQQVSMDLSDEQQKEIREQTQHQVREYFSGWNKENVALAYRRLLRRPDLLRQLGVGLFHAWDLELLSQDAPTNKTPFRFSDLAALMYLKLGLDGVDGVGYEHIVVDEAQDLTPLHFKVLQAYSRSSSMTLLGDIGQGIYGQHGIEHWDVLAEALQMQSLAPETLRESYRSTRQIIEFANAMLTRTGVAEDALAVPLSRPGPSPTLNRFQQWSQLVTNIINTVQDEQQKWSALAIVCKTAAACRKLAGELTTAGFTDYQLLVDRNSQYKGAITIIPSYLTKGMEFDVVIIADADAETYPPDALHVKLLYVVLTRAAHALHVRWLGAVTPLLDPQQPHVPLQPALAGALNPQPQTISQYAATRPGRDADWYVERLAQMDKLRLLEAGNIDAHLLDVVMAGYSPAASTNEHDEEPAIALLNEDEQQFLTEQADALSQADAMDVQDALALTQFAYGLLRNQLRSAGLELADDGKVSLSQQVILLTTLAQATRRGHVIASAGRWTTRQAVLQAVEGHRRAAAERWLTMFEQYGIIELQQSAQRTQIRVGTTWVQPLLNLGLGIATDSWDRELLEALPQLPTPFDVNALHTPR
ncbi:HelD family protein [Candidatus Viridilinea mediisalina]|uniref:HelD family protein n=1 Tax=Candidatus Viridilinea mediisalina TaxID=2024553 RepID=UPI0013FD9284|nr:UvrD-helicase domain-containing protein [Candidatus Viridilinea mediisalina]